MATEFRECAGVAQFNTGTSKCILDPGKVKAIILACTDINFLRM